MKSGNSKGGGGKSQSSGEKIVTSKARKTSAIDDCVITLRAAIFTPTGKDKDVTEGIAPAFMKYDRNGLDVVLQFSPKLTAKESSWAFDICKQNMEERYDDSGYGWDDDDKRRELAEGGARFLVIRQRCEGKLGDMVGFAHFRFTVQGDVADTMAGLPVLMLWDIHLIEELQRKGLGKHVLTVLELIARREQMKMITIPVQLNDEVASAWVSKCRGYTPDESLEELVGFDAETEGFHVYAKSLPAPVAKAAVVESTAAVTTTPTKVPSSTKGVPSPGGISDLAEAEAEAGRSREDAFSFTAEAGRSREDAFSFTAEAEVDDDEGEVRINDLDEHDIINGLKVMFLEKNKREATEDECQQWLTEIRAAKAEVAQQMPPAPPSSVDERDQSKIDKRTYSA